MDLVYNNISKSFGKHKVISNFSLRIKENEIFGILGVSGSGKSTLLKLLIGALKPDEGEIFYGDKNILKTDIRKLFGYSTQNFSFYDDLTVEQNLKYFGSIYGLKKRVIKENSEKLLEVMGLSNFKNLLAKKLSGGMQRRLDMCCALIHKPKILLLDEPLIGLDPLLRKELIILISEINKQGTTIILSSHLLEEVETLCSSVGIIKRGTLAIIGNPTKLKEVFSKTIKITIKSSPGHYHRILSSLKEKLDIKECYIREGINIEIPIKRSLHNAIYDIFIVLNKLKESIIKIEFGYPSLKDIFKEVLENE